MAAILQQIVNFGQPLKEQLRLQAYSDITVGSIFLLLGCVATTFFFSKKLTLIGTFVWNCFFRSLGKQSNQKGRLDSFYAGQAESKSLRQFKMQFKICRV